MAQEIYDMNSKRQQMILSQYWNKILNYIEKTMLYGFIYHSGRSWHPSWKQFNEMLMYFLANISAEACLSNVLPSFHNSLVLPAMSWKRWCPDSLGIVFGEIDIFWSNGHLISLTWVHSDLSSPHQGSLGHGFAAPGLTWTWICAPGYTRVCTQVSLSEPGFTQVRPSWLRYCVLTRVLAFLLNDVAMLCDACGITCSKLWCICESCGSCTFHAVFAFALFIVEWWCEPMWTRVNPGSLWHRSVHPGSCGCFCWDHTFRWTHEMRPLTHAWTHLSSEPVTTSRDHNPMHTCHAPRGTTHYCCPAHAHVWTTSCHMQTNFALPSHVAHW